MTHRVFILFVLFQSGAFAQLDFEREPIRYSESAPTDDVAKLMQRLESGKSPLKWEPEHGYLKSLLRELKIPLSSQTLVFSKTSLQVGRISPKTPRAIYFNDDVYVGWVQHGDLIEVSAADSALGGTFYSVAQSTSANPLMKRETSRCLQCHGSTHTRRIPGHIMRSVFTDSSGQPVFRLGTHMTDHRSAFKDRWGGWYVTGTHGEQRHMGNVVLEDRETSETLNTEAAANVTDLTMLLDVAPYLTPHSDIVALMVLQHQVYMHNVLTTANHSGRLTARDAITMNKALERDAEFESDSTKRRYESAAEKVVTALLFVDEPMLTSPVSGTSQFADEFAGRGPFDEKKRSLRTFDLQRRLFRYPCSFLIYSDAFAALPSGVLNRVKNRLREILSGEDDSDTFSHLSSNDRAAISEILNDTCDWLSVGAQTP